MLCASYKFNGFFFLFQKADSHLVLKLQQPFFSKSLTSLSVLEKIFSTSDRILFAIITLFSLLSAVYFSDYVKVHFLLQFIAIDRIYKAIAFSTLRKLRQSEKKQYYILGNLAKGAIRQVESVIFFSFNQK